MRDGLDEASLPSERIRLGSLLANLGAEAGGVDIDIERGRTPREPIGFE
ncbi:hypothetical protein [Nocardioides sp. AE5]|nr:hypothetical protein [Nocardioides sp. AE5]MDT0203019.1 hypothetical protein [Nocardioides sp. AE5]